MQEINVILEKQQKDMIHKQDEDRMKDRSIEDNIQVIKDVKETRRDEEMDEKVATFLHEKGLNKNLIETPINIGLTDERVRLLKTLNLNDDDIDNLQDLWQAKIKVDKSSDSINSTSDSLSSNGHTRLSRNNIYLKKVLGKLLIQALCEIVAKKPVDPVEYLAHWLLHYKICEKRAMQKDRELELSIDRGKLKLKKVGDKEAFFIERKDDEEEHSEDRNYLDYGKL